MEVNNKLVLSKFRFNEEELMKLNSKSGLKALIKNKKPKLKKILKELQYEEDLKLLQIELVKMQQWLKKENKRVAILFEGRDAAGYSAFYTIPNATFYACRCLTKTYRSRTRTIVLSTVSKAIA